MAAATSFQGSVAADVAAELLPQKRRETRCACAEQPQVLPLITVSLACTPICALHITDPCPFFSPYLSSACAASRAIVLTRF